MKEKIIIISDGFKEDGYIIGDPKNGIYNAIMMTPIDDVFIKVKSRFDIGPHHYEEVK